MNTWVILLKVEGQRIATIAILVTPLGAVEAFEAFASFVSTLGDEAAAQAALLRHYFRIGRAVCIHTQIQSPDPSTLKEGAYGVSDDLGRGLSEVRFLSPLLPFSAH